MGVAHGHPRNVHVVAKDNVTCFVFAPGEPTAFAGRGEDARFTEADTGDSAFDAEATKATTCIDACAYVERKVAALAAHRTQYPFKPDMFPLPMLEEMFGNEYFVRIHPRMEMEADLFSPTRKVSD